MPRVKFDYVVSFSSEDSENPASNLLAYEVSKKKWLCSSGEASCSVVLQLKHAVQISSVQIGAYHAALVEVLVARSETPNDQFEVLVPSSVFLSPMDSRRGAAVERVRSFGADQLAPAAAHKWDRVRVVCSQPYNKHCKYGLSFIHVFETEGNTKEPEPRPVAPAIPTRITAIGNYSSDEDDFKPGELFAKHRQSNEGSIKNTEAQIRQASSQALRNINDSATKLVKTPIAKTNSHRHNQPADFNTSRQKDNLMYTDDDEQPHAKIDSIVQRHKDEKEQETKKKEAVHNLFRKDKERSNRLEQSSKNFKEFLDDTNDKRSKESSKDSDKRSNDNSRSKDASRDNDRKNKDLNNSASKDSSRHDDRRKNDFNNSRSQDSFKDNKRTDLNSPRNKDSSRDDRRKKDDGSSSQSRTKTDAEASGSGDRDKRKRQHSDDRQKQKEVLAPGPVSAAPHTLMAGVVFALSGYENPRRARLRDAAVAMGARYERDWSPTCTHLICAFPNTPKLRTVRSSPSGANCIVVLGAWIEQCCEKKRLLPWQWFATEPGKKVQPPLGWEDDKTASECDTDDEIEKVLRKQKKQRTDKSPQPTSSSPKPHSSKDMSPTPVKSPEPRTSKEKSPKQTKREMSPKPGPSKEKTPKKLNISSDSDVAFVKDERIQANITIDSGDSTDEEKPVVKEKIDKNAALPDFFDGYTFVIEDCVEDAGFDKELLSRYVRAYGGIVMDAAHVQADSAVSFVLGAGAGRGGGGGGGGLRVRADWAWRCHRARRLLDVGDYAL